MVVGKKLTDCAVCIGLRETSIRMLARFVRSLHAMLAVQLARPSLAEDTAAAVFGIRNFGSNVGSATISRACAVAVMTVTENTMQARTDTTD